MPDVPKREDQPEGEAAPAAEDAGDRQDRQDRSDRQDRPPAISEFVRRAVSAGLEAATRGKDDIVRVATTEVRGWLDRLDLDDEIVKALSRMVIEVKAEIRFRPGPDGKLVPEAEQQTTIKPAPKT